MPGLINKYQAGLEVSIWAFIIGMVMFVVAACVMKGKQSDYDDEWSTLRKSLSIILRHLAEPPAHAAGVGASASRKIVTLST